MHQCTYHGKGKTIHSCVQVEHYGNDVNDKSRKVNSGKQRITTIENYIIPLQIREGLVYMDMRLPTDQELVGLPQVIFTSNMDWDPSIVDSDGKNLRTDNGDLAKVIWSPPKAPQNSTLSGNITNSIVDDTAHVDMPFSTVKVDLATLADDDPPIAVPIYTIFSVRQDRPNKPALLTTSPSNMKVALHSDREKVALLQVKGENNPLVNVALNRD